MVFRNFYQLTYSDRHKQASWHSVSLSERSGNTDLEPLHTAESSESSPTHSGSRNHRSGSGISPFLPEEPLEAHDPHDQLHSRDVRSTRRRSVRRSHDEPSPVLCVMETGLNGISNRRSVNSVASLPESIYDSSVESNRDLHTEDQNGTSTSSHLDSSPLAIGHMVPSVVGTGRGPSNTARPTDTDGPECSSSSLTLDKSELETLRLETIQRRFADKGYSLTAIKSLTKSIEDQTGLKSPYRRAQYLFLQWSLAHSVDPVHFSQSDLTNFLLEALAAGYSLSTIQIYLTAICLLHTDPDQVRSSTTLKALLKRTRRSAPSKEMLKPTVDIAPTLRFLAQIPSDHSAPLNDLNKKTQWPHYYGLPTLRGSVCLIAPAMMVAMFNLGNRQRPSGKLFTNSKNPAKTLRIATISSWLKSLERISTSQTPIPSVRSIASELALARGASLSDVVTMGNWSNSEVFDNHYRRQRLQSQNITNFVLRL
ncbi:hypothetical protein BC943DRAFT_351531 [Umbelopsis sp. AD052]|nr:hypothetical protein BC943DRAFT_351531 [Umbelopsis sp. AD052]